ncbi:MAG TPA: alpha-amylase family glycosyl hydrolase [Micavibrio sp.]
MTDINRKAHDTWWRGGVIYQIYPRSFKDANGDGVGDLRGILDHLPYVASLGVDAIWISPFFKSPMKDFGYDVSDYRAVDPVFGTLNDFKAVLDRAHDLGLKVLIDQVWCHSSDQHEWFQQSRQSRDNDRADWYIWADPKPDGTPPNNWLSWFGGPAWTWDARRHQYYLHHFLTSQPVLNYWHDAVGEAIRDIARFWLDMGVDGFRLDVANYYYCDRALRDNPARGPDDPIPEDPPPSNPNYHQIRIHSVNQPENLEYIKTIRAIIDEQPGRCLLGEAAGEGSAHVAARYTQNGNCMNLAYTFGLLGSDMTRAPVIAAVESVERTIEDGWVCWATSNHDFKRAPSRIPGDGPLADKALYAMALGLTLRGSYCLYQGEELGLPQVDLAYEDLQDPYDKALYPGHVGRDGGRTPMPWRADAPGAGFTDAGKGWLPVGPAHLSLAVDQQQDDPHSTLNQVRALIQWRKANPAMVTGDIDLLTLPAPFFAFRRHAGAQGFICVFNAGPAPATLAGTSLPGALALLPLSHNAQWDDNMLQLKPYGYAIFSVS